MTHFLFNVFAFKKVSLQQIFNIGMQRKQIFRRRSEKQPFRNCLYTEMVTRLIVISL